MMIAGRTRREGRERSACSASPSRRTARTCATRKVIDIVRELAVVRRRAFRPRPGGRPRRGAARVRRRAARRGTSCRAPTPIVLAVAHREFTSSARSTSFAAKLVPNGGVLIDVKSQVDAARTSSSARRARVAAVSEPSRREPLALHAQRLPAAATARCAGS